MKATRRTIQLGKGLSPSEHVPPNGEWLDEAMNLRMGIGGLELLPTLTDPLSLSVTWPWPQIVNLQREVLVIQADGLYVADSSWSVTQILAVTNADSDVWQISDFGLYWYATNGEAVYLRDVDGGSIAATDSSIFPTLGTMVDFNGQLVGGNVQSDWYDCDSRYAVWGNIGQNTFEPDWKNEAGYRDMKIGDVYRCLNFNDQGVVFYGSEGVALLTPAGNTFGYRFITSLPPIGPNAIGGWQEQLYVSADNELVQITGEGRKILGYKHLMRDMDSDLLRILVDPLNDDKYIVDDTFCYVFANGQLTESAALPTGLCAIDGSLVGARETGSTDVVAQLQQQDMNLVGMKSVEFLEVGVQTDGVVYGDLNFSYALDQDERTLGQRPANPSAFVYLGATANYFRPKVTIVGPTSLTLSYLTYGVKVSDNRIQNQLQTMSDRSWNAN